VFSLNSPIPEGTYIELVQSLFRTLLTTSIITLSFVSVAGIVAYRTPDGPLIALAVVGAILLVGRLAVLLFFRQQAADVGLSVARAHKLELLFAVSYLSFATIFGLFSARAFLVATQEAQVLVIGLLVGYAAGVAMGIAFRPWIGISAVVLGVLPTAACALASANPAYWALGALLAIFLAGGIHSMLAHYRLAAAGMTMKRLFADLAESDTLTGLPNRLGLGRRFNEATMLGPRRRAPGRLLFGPCWPRSSGPSAPDSRVAVVSIPGTAPLPQSQESRMLPLSAQNG
jgi:hypothetical protein